MKSAASRYTNQETSLTLKDKNFIAAVAINPNAIPVAIMNVVIPAIVSARMVVLSYARPKNFSIVCRIYSSGFLPLIP